MAGSRPKVMVKKTGFFELRFLRGRLALVMRLAQPQWLPAFRLGSMADMAGMTPDGSRTTAAGAN